MENTEEKKINPKRLELIKLSVKAKALKKEKLEEAKDEMELLYWQSLGVNDILIKFFYSQSDIKEFKTFNEWKRENKIIKKGEKAFIIWAMPRKATEKIKAKEPNKEDAESNYKFWPMCYLFSDKQVKDYEKENK